MGQKLHKSPIRITLFQLGVNLWSLRVRSRPCLLGAGDFGRWRVRLGRRLLAGLKIRRKKTKTKTKIRTRTRKKKKTRKRTRQVIRNLRGNFRHRHLLTLLFPIYLPKHPLPFP
jgi:hypothetical protein